MKDGLYKFQFGSNQDINIFYFHKRWNLQWNPRIKMNDIELLRSSLASPVTFQLKLNYSGFRYCMNHALKECKSNKHLNIENFIKCQAFFPHLLGKSSSLTKTMDVSTNVDQSPLMLRSMPCDWEWQPDMDSFNISIIGENDTHTLEKDTADINASTMLKAGYIPALFCKVYQYVGFKHKKKRVTFAIPFDTNTLMMPTSSSLIHTFVSPWVVLGAVLVIFLALSSIFCYQKNIKLKKHRR